MKRHMIFAMALTGLTWSVDVLTAAEDNNWSQFRGPGALGVAENKGLPEKWSATENVLWKQEVPGRGWS